MRAQRQTEVMRLAGCGHDGHGGTRPETVIDEAHQPVSGAVQNRLMGAEYWIAVVGNEYPQGGTVTVCGLAVRQYRQ